MSRRPAPLAAPQSRLHAVLSAGLENASRSSNGCVEVDTLAFDRLSIGTAAGWSFPMVADTGKSAEAQLNKPDVDNLMSRIYSEGPTSQVMASSAWTSIQPLTLAERSKAFTPGLFNKLKEAAPELQDASENMAAPMFLFMVWYHRGKIPRATPSGPKNAMESRYQSLSREEKEWWLVVASQAFSSLESSKQRQAAQSLAALRRQEEEKLRRKTWAEEDEKRKQQENEAKAAKQANEEAKKRKQDEKKASEEAKADAKRRRQAEKEEADNRRQVEQDRLRLAAESSAKQNAVDAETAQQKAYETQNIEEASKLASRAESRARLAGDLATNPQWSYYVMPFVLRAREAARLARARVNSLKDFLSEVQRHFLDNSLPRFSNEEADFYFEQYGVSVLDAWFKARLERHNTKATTKFGALRFNTGPQNKFALKEVCLIKVSEYISDVVSRMQDVVVKGFEDAGIDPVSGAVDTQFSLRITLPGLPFFGGNPTLFVRTWRSKALAAMDRATAVNKKAAIASTVLFPQGSEERKAVNDYMESVYKPPVGGGQIQISMYNLDMALNGIWARMTLDNDAVKQKEVCDWVKPSILEVGSPERNDATSAERGEEGAAE